MKKQKTLPTASVFEVNAFKHVGVTVRAFNAVVRSLANRFQEHGYEFDFEDYLAENFEAELRNYYSDKFSSRQAAVGGFDMNAILLYILSGLPVLFIAWSWAEGNGKFDEDQLVEFIALMIVWLLWPIFLYNWMTNFISND